jgi:protein TonB
MFGTLMESRAVPHRRRGSSLASIVIHGAIITGAVVATARDAMQTRPPEQLVHPLVYTVRVDVPRPQTHAVATASVLPVPAAVIQRLVIPSVIPTSIPAIDFGTPAPSSEFRAGPVGNSIVCGPDDCSGHAPIDGDRMLWSARDITMQLLDRAVPPRYPETLRRAGIEGSVTVKFVVDTTGRIDMREVEILSSDHELFSASVREALAKLRFSPSMVGERKVKALAVMPFRFTLR